ncbi:S41 family peptidase [Flavobacterium procerum]|uniref:S41 family peptidase n=1 Tax=Flavobacterium procerum TaxID=1455569 RepID=A0ABV6BW43_9FLAO
MDTIQKIGFRILIIAICLTGCEEDKPSSPELPIVSPVTGTRKQFTLDSIFLYARQIYLWNDALPSYSDFNPREKYGSISSDMASFNAELFDISQLKINAATALPFENPISAGTPKYSYLVYGKAADRQTASAQESSLPDNPVLKTAIVNAGTAKVGYIALSWFPEMAAAQTHLDKAFAQLAITSPQHLVIDLRSNGGGYVQTAEYVANLVVPSSLNAKKMYTEQFNPLMQQGKATILKHQPYLDDKGKPVIYNGRAATMADVDYSETGNTYTFSKKGSLESIKNVYFIVSGSTASAAEMLINCLKPYFNVKLAGTKTYGKPVGFFGVAIDQYTVYMSSFLIKNADGEANYFEGMQADIPAIDSGLYELGNPQESCLKTILGYIETGSIPTAKKTAKTSGLAAPQNLSHFNMMIENRRKLIR